MPSSRARGFTLVELVLVLVLIAILKAMAAPSLSGYAQRARTRGVLDRFTADLYQARAIAARNGERVQLRLERDGDGCVSAYSLWRDGAEAPLRRVEIGSDGPSVCLTISGSTTISVNSRGMPVGAARTLRARSGTSVDSLRISMVGRVHRLYAVPVVWLLSPRLEEISQSAIFSPRRAGAIGRKPA